jgi:hypothetical protein
LGRFLYGDKEGEKVFPLKEKNGTRKKFSEYLLSGATVMEYAAWVKRTAITNRYIMS